MKELNKEHLQKGIEELPESKPPKDLWNNIEHKLNTDVEKHFKEAIEDLPVFEPKLPFSQIAQNLEKRKGKKVQLSAKKYWLRIAASITLFMIGFQFFTAQTDQVNQEQITYTESEEVLSEPIVISQNLLELNQDDEVYQVILKNCETSVIKCEKPEFQELLNHYLTLNSERNSLFSEIQNKQQETMMLPHIVRIEKEKSKVGKMLIQLLLS